MLAAEGMAPSQTGVLAMGLKKIGIGCLGVLAAMITANEAHAFEVKVMVSTPVKVAECNGERACEEALNSAKSKGRSSARSKAAAACKSQESTFNAVSSKVLYVTFSDTNGPGLFDRSTRTWTYNWDVKCKLYQS